MLGFGLLLVALAVVFWARREGNAPVIELGAGSAASTLTSTQPPTAAAIPVNGKAASATQVAMMAPATMKAEGMRLMLETERKMEAIWAKDAPDAAAAAKTEQAIASALESNIVQEARWQPEATQFSCRASMCRIESEFDAAAAGGDWTARFLAQMGGRTFGNSSMVTLPGADGKKTVVVYAFRPGRGPRR